MIKLTRRDSLKVFSVAGLAAVMPTLSQARLLPAPAASWKDLPCDAKHTATECTHPQADIDITISRVVAKHPLEDYALVNIWNHSNESSTLRYIYPGVVEHEGAFYDLNSLLADGELKLEANQTVYQRLLPMQQAADRLNPPTQITQSGRLVIRDMSRGSQQVQDGSLRSFFA